MTGLIDLRLTEERRRDVCRIPLRAMAVRFAASPRALLNRACLILWPFAAKASNDCQGVQSPTRRGVSWPTPGCCLASPLCPARQRRKCPRRTRAARPPISASQANPRGARRVRRFGNSSADLSERTIASAIFASAQLISSQKSAPSGTAASIGALSWASTPASQSAPAWTAWQMRARRKP
jgi:hypothetical protein